MRKEYGSLSVDQAKRLKEVEKENTRLRKLVADLSLDKAILKEVAGSTSDQLIFGDADKDNLWFTQSGDDLVIDYVGTDDQVTIKDWYLGTGNHV